MDLENIMQDTIVIQARAREKQGEWMWMDDIYSYSLKSFVVHFVVGLSIDKSEGGMSARTLAAG